MDSVSETDDNNFYLFTLFTVVTSILCFAVVYIVFSSERKERKSEASKNKSSKSTPKPQTVANTAKTSKKPLKVSKPQKFSYPDLIVSFKGHTDLITSAAVSFNGKGFITVGLDRTLFAYSLRDIKNSSVTATQGARTNIQYDHVEKLCWSPDYTTVMVHKADSRAIEVLKGVKKNNGLLSGFVKISAFKKPFSETMVGFAVASSGKFIVTCDSNNNLCLWSQRGELLSATNTLQGKTTHATLTLDDRFIATSGFTPDVKVFEIFYDKSDALKAVKKAFELTGHSSTVYCCHSSPDSSKMVTVSKDGSWLLHSTAVDYARDLKPEVMCSGAVPEARSVADGQTCVVRLSPDSRVVIVAVNLSVYCYSASTGSILRSLENIYSTRILDVFVDAGNSYFITVGDNCAHVFINVAGYQATVQDLQVSLKQATYAGMKARIKNQLEAARAVLETVEQRTASASCF